MEVKEYKDGIYRGDYGITYFVLNEKILMKHLEQCTRQLSISYLVSGLIHLRMIWKWNLITYIKK